MELTENIVKFSGLRSEMAKYGHKNHTLAKLLDLTESSISRRFTGEISWSKDEMDIICKFYKKTMDQLFT